jgi:hypothetical protein
MQTSLRLIYAHIAKIIFIKTSLYNDGFITAALYLWQKFGKSGIKRTKFLEQNFL